jgi:hypothetical protein
MDKKILYIMITIGGVVGGYLPVLLGASGLSIWSILGSGAGSIAGIFVAAKLS